MEELSYCQQAVLMLKRNPRQHLRTLGQLFRDSLAASDIPEDLLILINAFKSTTGKVSEHDYKKWAEPAIDALKKQLAELERVKLELEEDLPK